jgi:FtsK/SpoIIIE family
VNTTSHDRVDYVGWLIRQSWRRRLEIGLTLAITVARVGLVLTLGPQLGYLILAVLAFGVAIHRPSRQWAVRLSRKERLEWQCDKAFEAAGIDYAVCPVVLAQRPTPTGAVLDLRLTPRCTVKDLVARTEPLAVAFHAASVRIRADRGAAGRAQLVIAFRDPLAGSPFNWPWIGIERTQLWGGLPLGYDEDDSFVMLDLAGHHLLLGGEPGSGKSNALSLIVAAAALDPNTELWCFDGKLVELAAWKRSCRRFVGPDLEEATKVLIELRDEMEERYAWLLELGVRKMDRDLGAGLILVVIDELALYLQGKGKQRDQFAGVLRDIVARGRAAGIVVVAATQKPASDVVPTSIRDLFGYRLALRCATRDASDTVLGVGWATEGFTASDIDPANRGVGYLLAEGSLPRRMRCFVLSDEHLTALSRRAEKLRGTAP